MACRIGATAIDLTIDSTRCPPMRTGMVSPEGVTNAEFDVMERPFSAREVVELTMMAAYYSGSAQTMRFLGVYLEKEADGYGKCGASDGAVTEVEGRFCRSRIATVDLNALRRGSH
jgi:hypothetical protein